MPISETPTKTNKPSDAAEPLKPAESEAKEIPVPGGFLGLPIQPEKRLEVAADARMRSSSRWVDYDTHELLEMIGELEDERRWSRLREGFWLAILFHMLLFSAITWIPTYVFKVPKVVDPFDVIQQRKDLTYLDTPPDLLRQRPKTPPPLPKDKPLIDKKTLDEMKREAPPAPEQPKQEQAPEQPQPTQPIPQQQQAQVEAPKPAAVPAKPNFALGAANPADQLREDMRKSMHGHGEQNYGDAPSRGLSMHPGAGSGGVQILSDTQGVDFSSWLARWHYITERTWDPLIPDEVNPPILKSGVVVIRFKVLPNGQVVDMQLDGRSGDTGLDRAAWGAITGSSYPSLPREFHGPYLELRAYFLYNMQPR